jgi:hypothetical protein
MARERIPEKTQTSILLKSRRRCCLCFWLEGVDEVKKGQLAHLEWDHSNSTEGNLAFMCFDHHNEYDSTPSQSKGLREKEVKKWRDELYKEMQYRFRTIKKHGFELEIIDLVWFLKGFAYKAIFRLKNTGEISVKTPLISIRLPDYVMGRFPELPALQPATPWELPRFKMPDIWEAREEESDLFEEDGRISVKRMNGVGAVLMPGHTFEFEALVFGIEKYPSGTEICLDYRVDGEDVSTVEGSLKAVVPDAKDMTEQSDE